MIKKTLTYTDYDGNERTEDFYFNLSKAELMEMDFSASGGMEKMIKRIVDAQDTKRIIEVFKDIILKSYGEKSADGRRFIKVSDGRRLAEDFAQTEAYSELYMELATNDKAATEFINGVIPQSLAAEIAANQE
jgi:hypothetical protein